MIDHFAVNGRVVPAAEATVSVLDLGFLRGVGAFETLRTYGGGHPHALAEHLRRLWESAQAVGVAPFFSESDVRRLLEEIRLKSGHDELRCNFVVTPGPHLSGVFGGGPPTWVMICRDLHPPTPEQYARGVAAITFAATRHLPALKTTNYLTGTVGIQRAEAAGAHEAFYVDAQGYVTEGVTSNVLVVQGNRVLTPTADCLPGITKAGIRPIAEELGLTWYERRLTRDDLYTADEIWITSAVRELLPVVKVDDKLIATGEPGRWARAIGAKYHAACVADARRDAGAA